MLIRMSQACERIVFDKKIYLIRNLNPQTHITMENRLKTRMFQIGTALLTTPGDTNKVQREHIIDYVVSKTLGLEERPESFEILDRDIISLVDKITFAAYSIEDEDLAMLGTLGMSDDAIYEIILSAAYGAGLARMQLLYSLLHESQQ